MDRNLSLRSENGQAATELALVLPILAAILLAIAQFGILFNNYITLTDATRAGARKAAVGRQSVSPVSDCQAAIRSSAKDLKPSDLVPSCSSTWQPGADVTVTATYPYKISLLGLVVKTGRLSSTTTERVE